MKIVTTEGTGYEPGEFYFEKHKESKGLESVYLKNVASKLERSACWSWRL